MIAIDFDGTIVEEKNYPLFGAMIPYARQVILGLKAQHHIIVLYTLRDQRFETKTMISPYLKTALDLLESQKIKHCFQLPRDFAFHNYGYKFPFDFYIDDKAYVDGKVDWLGIAKKFNIEVQNENA